MPSFTAGFVNWYAEHLQKKAQKKVDKIRQVQSETGRLAEQVIEIQIYGMDLRQRNRIQQEVWVRRYRFLKDGTYQVLPVGPTRPDSRIYTDTPTLIGVAYGHQQSVKEDGSIVSREKFTVYDALRLGHIDYDGETTALRNLALLQKKILPELARELKLIPDPSP